MSEGIFCGLQKAANSFFLGTRGRFGRYKREFEMKRMPVDRSTSQHDIFVPLVQRAGALPGLQTGLQPQPVLSQALKLHTGHLDTVSTVNNALSVQCTLHITLTL